MTHPRIAFAGASGWLGRFIGPALLRAGITGAAQFTGLNRSGAHAAYADWPDLRWCRTLSEVTPAPEVLVLSLRPADFRAARFDCPQALVISVMAGVGLEELRAATGSARIIRTLPNALVESGQSFSPWLATAQASAQDRDLARRILAACGTEAEVESEAQLDVLTALSGAGPAYAALMATALMRAGTTLGLSPEVARGAAENLVCASAGQLAGRMDEAPGVVQAFIDYDGVIAAELRVAQTGGFDALVLEALRAGLSRVQKMNDEG